MSRRQFVNGVGASLPSQRQPPSPDSVVWIVVSRGAKLDILIRDVVRHRKDLLYTFVELLGKRFQVLRGIEFGIL